MILSSDQFGAYVTLLGIIFSWSMHPTFLLSYSSVRLSQIDQPPYWIPKYRNNEIHVEQTSLCVRNRTVYVVRNSIARQALFDLVEMLGGGTIFREKQKERCPKYALDFTHAVNWGGSCHQSLNGINFWCPAFGFSGSCGYWLCLWIVLKSMAICLWHSNRSLYLHEIQLILHEIRLRAAYYFYLWFKNEKATLVKLSFRHPNRIDDEVAINDQLRLCINCVFVFHGFSNNQANIGNWRYCQSNGFGAGIGQLFVMTFQYNVCDDFPI